MKREGTSTGELASGGRFLAEAEAYRHPASDFRAFGASHWNGTTTEPWTPEEPGPPPKNHRNEPPEGTVSLDFNRKRFQTDPRGGGPPGGPPGVIATSCTHALCGVASFIPSKVGAKKLAPMPSPGGLKGF